MWRYTANRYKDNPVVVGYDLMVEPNSNEAAIEPDEWDPDVFETTYGGTTYDWNSMWPGIVSKIREVDTQTPILVGGMGYSAIEWLPYVDISTDSRIVYVVHQYAPVDYTHQDSSSSTLTYPGTFDTDWDTIPDTVDKTWIDNLLSTVDTFMTSNNAEIAINEFGGVRYTPGIGDFVDDQMDLFEGRGINHALWAWNPSYAAFNDENDDFDIEHGSDPSNHTDLASNMFLNAVKKHWANNTVRPSNFGD